MSTPIYVDSGVIVVVLLALFAVFTYVWRRYLCKLGPKFQTLIDVIAIVFSALVILAFPSGLLFRLLAWQ